MSVALGGRGRGDGPAVRPIRFREAMIGFVLMTALVTLAASGLLILFDPRAQAFWGARFSELGGLIKGSLDGWSR